MGARRWRCSATAPSCVGLEQGFAFALVNLAWSVGRQHRRRRRRAPRPGGRRRGALPDPRRALRAHAGRRRASGHGWRESRRPRPVRLPPVMAAELIDGKAIARRCAPRWRATSASGRPPGTRPPASRPCWWATTRRRRSTSAASSGPPPRSASRASTTGSPAGRRARRGGGAAARSSTTTRGCPGSCSSCPRRRRWTAPR